jgi:hypothetical protein
VIVQKAINFTTGQKVAGGSSNNYAEFGIRNPPLAKNFTFFPAPLI